MKEPRLHLFKLLNLFAVLIFSTGCFLSTNVKRLGSATESTSAPISDTTPINKSIYVEIENAPVNGTTSLNHSVSVISLVAEFYIYKFGSVNDIDCTSLDNYSSAVNINTPLPVVVSSFNGEFALCVMGVSASGEKQDPATAVKHIWRQSWVPFVYIEKPGQALVSTTAATLNIHAPAEWIEVYVTNDPGCATGGVWNSTTQTVSVTLVPDVATKDAITYVIFRDVDGRLSDCVSDSIKVSSPISVGTCTGTTNSDAPIGEFIDSGGPTGDYTDNENCSIVLTGGPKVFTFDFFDTEGDYDFITIYKDSTLSPGNILVDISGNTPPLPVVSTSDTNIIRFTSDGSVTMPGYKVSWTTPSISGTNSVKIAGGAETSSTRNVTIDIQYIGQFVEMYLTNDVSCSVGGAWQHVATSVPWSLTVGNGNKNVYIKFRDPGGRESTCESDAILMYDGPPAMATLTGLPVNNSGDNNLNVTVGGTDIFAYKYKFGPTGTTDCTIAAGYSSEVLVSAGIFSSLLGYGNGSLTLCVLGINPIGVAQSLTTPTTHTWFRNVPMLIQFQSSGETIAEGATSVSFKVISNGNALTPITIDYDVYGDFVASEGYTSGQVIIPTGQSEATITLAITSNPVASTDRRISVGLSDISIPHRQGLISTASKIVIDAQRAAAGVVDIGYYSSCAILNDGKLVCRDFVGGERESTDRFVEGFQHHTSSDTFTSIVIDQAHKCALNTANELYCWGWGFDGQLGLGNGNTQRYPVKIPGFVWKMVTSSQSWNNMCGINSSDDLYCWGDGTYSYGANGTGSTNDSYSPTQLDIGTKYKFVTISGTSVCAITLATSQLKCWGQNFNSRLGNGDSVDQSTPVPIDVGTAYSSVDLSNNYSLGLTNSGAWKIWGTKVNSASYQIAATPEVVDSSRVYTKLVGHSKLACGLSGGYLYCVGQDYNNRMGFGNTILTPVIVDSVDQYSQVAASSDFVCGITLSGQLKCFGEGLSSSQSQMASASVPALPTVWDSDTFTKLIKANRGMCAITSSGNSKCVYSGYSANNMHEYRHTWIPRLADSTMNVKAITNRYVVTENNKTYIWGQNVEGDYSFDRRTNPFRILRDHDVKLFSESNGLKCFINTANKIFCWGTNPGNGSASSTIPVAVDSSVDYSYVGVGNDFGCGLTTGGIVKCWGANAQGQLGLNDLLDRLSPEIVDTGYIKLATAASHVCGLKTGGALYCWGQHYVGLGNGATQASTPQLINSGDTFSDLVVGSTNCVIRSDNSRVMCWGYGPIGDVSASSRTSLTLTSDASAYTKLYGGGGTASTCGKTGTTLKCWGNYKWTRAYSPVIVYTGAFKDLFMGSTNLLVDNSGKIYYFGNVEYTPFGQQSYPKFETILGLVDRVPPVAP